MTADISLSLMPGSSPLHKSWVFVALTTHPPPGVCACVLCDRRAGAWLPCRPCRRWGVFQEEQHMQGSLLSS